MLAELQLSHRADDRLPHRHGQGALGLTATTATALWFTRRRGTAVGIVSAAGAAGISLAPLLLERLVAAHGWRAVWAGEGVAIWLCMLLLAGALL